MADKDPKERPGNRDRDDRKIPPGQHDQADASTLRKAVDEKVDALFGGLDDDDNRENASGAVDAPAEEAPEPVPDSDRKGDRIRADVVGALDDEEEDVVDWVDEEPEPELPPTDIEPDAPSPEPPEVPETEVPLPKEDASKVQAAVPATAIREPDKKQLAASGKTRRPSQKTPPRKGHSPRSSAKAVEKPTPVPQSPESAAPAKSRRPARKPIQPTPEETPKPRQSLLPRILLWGLVLLIITFTVRYFFTYEPDIPAQPTAESGHLFHKVALPPPTAGSEKPPQGNTAKAQTARLAKPAAASEAPVTPKAPAAPQTPAVKTEPDKKAKAYTPGTYPYAIHMASFHSLETARENVATYRRGFQAYLVRIDLGKKGIWYRLFLGHFPNATSALDAIRKYHLKGAIVSRNRFACLIGSYASGAKARATIRKLEDKGFFPYTLINGDTRHVFAGAFAKETDARNLSQDLAAKGIQNNLIKR